MSHITATIDTLSRMADQAAATVTPCPWNRSMSSCSIMDSAQVPLAERTSVELRLRAAELRRMAATATTADTRASLESLVMRFTALADRREAEERCSTSRRNINPPG
jgi:hypothetical protein